MRKWILSIIFIFAAVLVLPPLFGFYPVAIVNGHFISYRAWKKVEKASLQFVNAGELAKGLKITNFQASENAVTLLDIRRGALLFLIEGEILRQEGERTVEDFSEIIQKRVTQALRKLKNP